MWGLKRTSEGLKYEGPMVDVSFTASCAAPTGRVPGLRGASSSPVHRALVLVLGTNIAVLLDCSKSSRQCSLPYLLVVIHIPCVLTYTYLWVFPDHLITLTNTYTVFTFPAAMASAAIARAAAVGPTAAAPQAHANSSMLSAKAIALVMLRVLARRAPACADKTRDGGDGDGGGNDWDNAAGERAPGARGNEVTTQEVQLAAGAQQHQCLAQLQQEFCQLSTKDASFDDEDLDDQALLEAARELAEQSSSTELCCSGLKALSVEADTCATDEAAAAAARIQAAWVEGPPAGRVRAASRPCAGGGTSSGRHASVRGAGLLAGRAVKGVS